MMGRRLNQYLGSFSDDGRPKVAFVFDDETAPADADVVYRLSLRGRPSRRDRRPPQERLTPPSAVGRSERREGRRARQGGGD